MSSHGSHAFGVEFVSSGPGRQRGPSAVAGIGSRAHVEPAGVVPSLTKTGAATAAVEPSRKRIACASRANSSGVLWKHSSVSGCDAGHSRYW